MALFERRLNGISGSQPFVGLIVFLAIVFFCRGYWWTLDLAIAAAYSAYILAMLISKDAFGFYRSYTLPFWAGTLVHLAYLAVVILVERLVRIPAFPPAGNHNQRIGMCVLWFVLTPMAILVLAQFERSTLTRPNADPDSIA